MRGLELFEQHMAKENKAVDAFIADAEKILTAVQKDKIGKRKTSLVTMDGGNMYSFMLLGEKMNATGKEKTIDVLTKLIAAVNDSSDPDFRTFVENRYKNSPELAKEPKIRKKREPKAAVVDADVIVSLPLRPRT